MAARRPSILGAVVCGWDVGPSNGGIVYCAKPATHYTDHPHCYGMVCGIHAGDAEKSGHHVAPMPSQGGA